MCVIVFVCACVCSSPRSHKRKIESLWLEIQAVANHPTWVLGTKLNLLQEQQVLVAVEPSLQPPDFIEFFSANIYE